jgi:co-chaperonin GroES (HSP10)
MNIKPLHDQVLVKVLPNETSSAFGIILQLPKTAPKQGEVIAVGPGLRMGEVIRPMSVKVGDKLIFD